MYKSLLYIQVLTTQVSSHFSYFLFSFVLFLFLALGLVLFFFNEKRMQTLEFIKVQVLEILHHKLKLKRVTQTLPVFAESFSFVEGSRGKSGS